MTERHPRLSGKEQLILEMMSAAMSRELYGLELVNISAGKLVRGTVYVTLNRMEEKGLITSRQEEAGPGVRGIPRRLYKMTGHGARMLAAYRHFAATKGRSTSSLAAS